MYFAGNYRQIGSIDITPLRRAVEALSEDDWNQAAERQRDFQVHAQTRFIPLVFDDDFRHIGPTRLAMMDRLESELTAPMDCIRAYFAPVHAALGRPPGEGYFVRAILTRLAAGGEITSHVDAMPSLMRSHRVHLPIVTNDRVLFAIRGDIRHLPAGQLWEINNRRSHAVRNLGADRIHLILDYVVPGETIEDPDGRLVA